ncbi:MAG: T9SS type A sorting domain-containing protein, partial [Prolixibacteraceae bacterium]|nr:T9SS type A sorting domain-containing protein [Prolixibacteraceae bacterium]
VAPMIADTGCVNILVTATDAASASAADTFEVCVDGYPVSISDLGAGKFEVQLYPNPTQGKVNVDFNSTGIYSVDLSVVDITGKEVLRKQFSAAEKITFDMSNNVSGMYFVQLQVDGKRIVKKLVVDRK